MPLASSGPSSSAQDGNESIASSNSFFNLSVPHLSVPHLSVLRAREGATGKQRMGQDRRRGSIQDQLRFRIRVASALEKDRRSIGVSFELQKNTDHEQ
jgi:hypothetical protein